MYRQSDKNVLSSNISSTCHHNMVNFGPLAAEIISLVWGTPGNFNGFRVLAALLHGTLVVGVSQTAALNRGRHLYSAGRPSLWALAHICSSIYSHFFALLLGSRRAGTVGPIFTVIRHNDVFPRKKVTFGGRSDITPHLGGQIPQNHQFGA